MAVLLGRADTGASGSHTETVGSQLGHLTVALETGVVDSVTVRVTAANLCTDGRVAIFSDVGTGLTPNVLLGNVGTFTPVASTLGFVQSTGGMNAPVVKGGRYWIVTLSPTGGGALVVSLFSTTGGQDTGKVAGAAILTPWGSNTGNAAEVLNFFAEGVAVRSARYLPRSRGPRAVGPTYFASLPRTPAATAAVSSDVNVTADTGTASTGGTASLTLTYIATGGSATTAGAVSLAAVVTASTGAATATGTLPVLTVTLTAASGGATASGGTVTEVAVVSLVASTGTATAAGSSTTLSFTFAASSGAATAAGGTSTRAFTYTAASGTATATGTLPVVTFVYGATTGAATAGGGSATVSLSGGSSVSASNGTATASGTGSVLSVTYTATGGSASATGGTVNRINPATGGLANATGGTASLAWTFAASTGTSTASGGTATAVGNIPSLRLRLIVTDLPRVSAYAVTSERTNVTTDTHAVTQDTPSDRSLLTLIADDVRVDVDLELA